jgi:hypothetical protein
LEIPKFQKKLQNNQKVEETTKEMKKSGKKSFFLIFLTKSKIFLLSYLPLEF